jgi:hypothetical protein
MRVCIVGNSHVAALRKAWEPWRRAHKGAKLDVTFFGSHSASLRNVTARDGRFTTDDAAVRRTLAMTTGRADPELAIADFDLFVLYGLVNPNWYVAYSAGEGIDRPPTLPRVSRGLLRALAEQAFRQSLAMHMYGLVRSASQAPVIVAPQPYLSQAVIGDPNQSPYGDAPPADLAARPALLSALDEVLAAAAAREGFRWLAQPAQTVVDDHWTRPEYCVDSVRLSAQMDIAHPDDDYAHMNQRYGDAVLDILAALIQDTAAAGAKGSPAKARAVDAA